MSVGFLYGYRARCLRVVDGDTLDLEVDLGFRLTVRERFRLLGIDAPEIRAESEEERSRAVVTTVRLRELVIKSGEWPLLVETFKPDSFGRWLARVWIRDEAGESIDVAKQLLAEGLARIR